MSDHQQHDLLAALGRAVDRAWADRRAATSPMAGQGDPRTAEGVDRTDGSEVVEQVGKGEVEHEGLLGGCGDQDAAEPRTLTPLTSRSTGELEDQVWEQRVPGTDIATTRVRLHVDQHGRVTMHEAIAAQLLAEAGWERAR